MAEVLALDKTYPEGKTYSGPAEVGIAKFEGPPEQLLPTSLAVKIAEILVRKIKENQGVLLKMRIWVDKAPIFSTKYRIEVVLTDQAIQAQQGLATRAPFPWAILIGALLIIGLVALTTWTISRIDWEGLTTSIQWGIIALVVGGLLLLGLSERGKKHGKT